MQPEVVMTEDEKEAEKVLSGNADFEFSIAYEVIPRSSSRTFPASRSRVPSTTYRKTKSKSRCSVSPNRHGPTRPRPESRPDGDRVTIDFVGKIDGEPFDGGAGTDQQLVLGSKTFIPGFEDQLVGVKAGDEKVVTVTFPEDYGAAHLAGKEAAFDVTVKEVSKANELKVDDEVAKQLGLESAERLREIVKQQIESQFGALTRQKVKRELLDRLDESYSFESPEKLVEAEFQNIWNQVTRELDQAVGLLLTRRLRKRMHARSICALPSVASASGWCSPRSAKRPAFRFQTTNFSARCSISSVACRVTSSRKPTISIAPTPLRSPTSARRCSRRKLSTTCTRRST